MYVMLLDACERTTVLPLLRHHNLYLITIYIHYHGRNHRNKVTNCTTKPTAKSDSIRIRHEPSKPISMANTRSLIPSDTQLFEPILMSSSVLDKAPSNYMSKKRNFTPILPI